AEPAGGFSSGGYRWMCGGRPIAAGTAWYVASSPAIIRTISPLIFWGVMFAQLGIVFVLSGRVQQLAASPASLLFILCSVLTGFTIAFVLLAYTGESVARTFLVAAAMFAGLALYGTITKRSLGGF